MVTNQNLNQFLESVQDKKLNEVVVLSQLPKEKRLRALAAQKGRKEAGIEAGKKLANLKRQTPNAADWHLMSPAKKAALTKKMGFGVKPEETTEKRGYSIVRNAHTTPDDFYRDYSDPIPFIWIEPNLLLHRQGGTHGLILLEMYHNPPQLYQWVLSIRNTPLYKSLIDYVAEQVQHKTPKKNVTDQQALQILKSETDSSKADKYIASRAILQFMDEIMYGSATWDEYGFVDGRWADNKLAVWVYLSDADIERLVKLFESKTGEEVKTVYVPSEGSSQHYGFGDEEQVKSRVSGVDGSEGDQEKERLTTQEMDFEWIDAEGDFSNGKTIAGPTAKGGQPDGAMQLAREGWIRTIFETVPGGPSWWTGLKVQFLQEYVSLKALAKLHSYIEEYKTKIQSYTIQHVPLGKSQPLSFTNPSSSMILSSLSGMYVDIEDHRKKKKTNKTLAADMEIKMDKQALNSFLENIECGKKNLQEGVNASQLMKVEELIEKMGFESFVKTMLYLIQQEAAPIPNVKEIVPHVKEILSIVQKKPE